MNCNNYFDMTDQGDSFETWQGLRGPAGPQGPAGAPGAPGTSVELRGPVETTGDLPATASSSELWLVGSAAPYHGWFYNGEAWEDAGEIAVGPTGPQGPAGADGTDGSDGVTFTPTVSSAGVISWTNDGSLPNPDPVDIKGPQGQTGQTGPAGQDGTDGSNGVTFTPAVSSAGVISWTNDGGLPNPDSVNIKGPQGETGATGPQGPQGATGQTGPAGPGVPSGGSTGQVLKKKSATDYDTEWSNAGTADALPLAGGTMSGSINMDGNRVQNLPTPSANGDAASKGYTDGIVSVSDTQPTAAQNKLWVDTDGGSGASYQVPTVAEMQAADALSAKADEIGIVITGARPAAAVSPGQYVIVRSSTITGITDGLYINSSGGDLSPSTDVTAADLTAVSGGGLNDITQITAYTSNALTFGSGVTVSANYSTLYKYGKLCIVSANIGATYDQTQSAGALIIATFANSVKPMNNTDILGVIEANGTVKNITFTLRNSGEIAIYGANSTIYKNPKFFGVFIGD